MESGPTATTARRSRAQPPNLVGDVTLGSVYAHIDQSLRLWGGQRPVFKTNVKSFVSLRKAAPPIALEELPQLAKHFPKPGFNFPLDPSDEPERSQEQRDDPSIPPPDPAKNVIFKVLQNYVRVNLVRRVSRHQLCEGYRFRGLPGGRTRPPRFGAPNRLSGNVSRPSGRANHARRHHSDWTPWTRRRNCCGGTVPRQRRIQLYARTGAGGRWWVRRALRRLSWRGTIRLWAEHACSQAGLL